MAAVDTAASASGVSLSQIGQIAVYVDDVDRAVAFYRDTLGMRFLFQFPGLGFFDCAGVRLMLDKAARDANPDAHLTSSTIYYKVDDLEATVAALKAKGVTFVHEPHLLAKMPDHDLWMAFLKDTEGNTLALMHEKRPPAPRS